MHVLPVVPEARADGAAGDGDLLGEEGVSFWGGWCGEGVADFEGKGGGRYRRGPGGAAAATIRDDGVGGWGEGGVVAVVCGG